MLKNLSRILLITPVILSTLMIVTVKAQETEGLNDTFNRAVNNSSGTFFDLTSLSGQANAIFGWRTWPMGSFPENQISEDARTVEILLNDTIRQQNVTPPVRTRDLNNPFNTSVQQNPNYIRSGESK